MTIAEYIKINSCKIKARKTLIISYSQLCEIGNKKYKKTLTTTFMFPDKMLQQIRILIYNPETENS